MSQHFALAFAADTSAWEANSGGVMHGAVLFPLALLHGSQVFGLASTCMGRAVRLPHQLALQLAMVWLASAATVDICTLPLFRHPAAAVLMARAYVAASWATVLLPVPLSVLQPASACFRWRCVLTATQLVGGLILPVLFPERREARLWERACEDALVTPGLSDQQREALRAEALGSWRGRMYALLLRYERWSASASVWRRAVCWGMVLGTAWQLTVAGVQLSGGGGGASGS